MSWNHRVLAHKDPKGDIYFQIHVVYYNNEGILDGYTSNPISVGGENLEEIAWTLDSMKKCLEKDILWAGEDFPKVYKQK